MKPATSSDSASSRVEGRPVGLGQRRDEEHHEHRQERQPVPAEQPPGAVLRLDDADEIERAGEQQHGDDDEADRDFVGDHLRRRPERGEEGVFRVRRPARHDHAVDLQAGDGEDVEDADIDVGDGPALVDRDDRPGRERQPGGDERREQEEALVGAGRDDRLLEHEFQKIGEGLQQAEGPDHVRPAPHLHRRPDFAVGIEQEGDDDAAATTSSATAMRRDEGRAAGRSWTRTQPSVPVALSPRLACIALRARHDGRGARDRIGEIEILDGQAEALLAGLAGFSASCSIAALSAGSI